MAFPDESKRKMTTASPDKRTVDNIYQHNTKSFFEITMKSFQER